MNMNMKEFIFVFIDDSNQIVAWSGAVLDERLLAIEWASETTGDALQRLLSNCQEIDSNLAWYATITAIIFSSQM